MKRLLVLAFLLFAKNVFAQKDTVGLNIPLVDNAVVYERVYDVSKVPQSLLYSNARVWFAGTHPNGGSTQLILRDSVLSRVAGRASYIIQVPNKVLWTTETVTYNYNFTVQIDCKDSKYRIRIYNIQTLNNTTPIEAMLQSLVNSKSFISSEGILGVNNLKQRLQILNTVINDLLVDVNKKMLDNNDF